MGYGNDDVVNFDGHGSDDLYYNGRMDLWKEGLGRKRGSWEWKNRSERG